MITLWSNPNKSIWFQEHVKSLIMVSINLYVPLAWQQWRFKMAAKSFLNWNNL